MALSLGRATASTTARAAQLNQIIDFLEGAAGENLAIFLRSAAGADAKILLSDNAGVRSFQIVDSDAVAVFTVNSNGDVTPAGSFNPGTFVVPGEASPSTTTAGSLRRDTDDHFLVMGTGAAAKRLGLVVGAGAAPAVTGEMAYNTTTKGLSIYDGSAVAAITPALQEAVYPDLPQHAILTTSSAGTANRAYFVPIEPLTADVTVTTLVTAIGLQNGNIDAAIYSWDGTTMTRVVSLGSTACPAAATRVVLNIADTVLSRGTRYFFAYAQDAGTAQPCFIAATSVFAPSSVGYHKDAAFPLPATVATLTAAANTVYMVGSITGGIAV